MNSGGQPEHLDVEWRSLPVRSQLNHLFDEVAFLDASRASITPSMLHVCTLPSAATTFSQVSCWRALHASDATSMSLNWT